MGIDWDKQVTFGACYTGYDVDVTKLDYGYRIHTAGYVYDVDALGKAFNLSFKDKCFDIRNT